MPEILKPPPRWRPFARRRFFRRGLTPADAGKIMELDAPEAKTFIIPEDAFPFAEGAELELRKDESGDWRIKE